MLKQDRYDSLIQFYFFNYMQALNPSMFYWVKAQVKAESNFNPNAVSSVGAQGLMQIMPATGEAIYRLLVKENPRLTWDPFNPELNIMFGINYLATQFNRFPEIPDLKQRLFFSFGAYNGGRGYINEAIRLARMKSGAPYRHADWVNAGAKPGPWQDWDYTSKFLADPRCVVAGRRPDHKQIINYVLTIQSNAKEMSDEH